MRHSYKLLLAPMILLASCAGDKDQFDASGMFESTEVIVSAQGNGKILQFDVHEGEKLQAGAIVGYIDTTQLHWRKQQLQASSRAITVTKPNVSEQIAAIEQQITNTETEKRRIENLVQADAVPQKQLDDINEHLKVLQKQLDAQTSTVSKSARGIEAQTRPVYAQIQEIDEQLQNSIITNPINGTVLTKYAEQDEVTMTGKPLYRIADMDNMILRVYVTGDQLSQIKLGQDVKVYVDSTAKTYRELPGRVSWIASEAEFTPKTIQTKDERANLVYAVKVNVKNDGYLKIGMYGEIKFK